LAACAAAACATLWMTDAAAYCRTSTCNPAVEECQTINKCLVGGKLLYWSSECLSFGIQKSGSAKSKVDFATMTTVVEDGFRQWLGANCNGNAPSFKVFNYGPITCNRAEYNQTQPNSNIFMFRDENWPYANTEDTLALTTVTFNVNTGEIYDADVEVNSFAETFAIDNVGAGDIDLRSVLTHEIGHFLGLSHTNVPGATMVPAYLAGNTALATIEADDVAGICDAFKPGRNVVGDSCEPRHGFSRECSGAEEGCCSTAPGGRTSPYQTLALFAAGALALMLRTRRSAISKR
jgi:hypothetical protein